MLGIFAANHHYHAIAADHFAVLATRLDRRPYLHLSTTFQLQPAYHDGRIAGRYHLYLV
jgi:hypothetical protein